MQYTSGGRFIPPVVHPVYRSLLREIESSGLTCFISEIPTSPVGYADDLSVCSTSKYKLNKAMKLVYEYSCKWRFFYNPDKSAVMVTAKKEVKQPRTKNIEMSPLVVIKLKRELNMTMKG